MRRRDTDAGILYGKLDRRRIGIFTDEARAQRDAARVGEFDGIAEQIHQDLVEKRGIGTQAGRDAGIVVQLERDRRAVEAKAGGVAHGAHGIGQVERPEVELHFTFGNLGNIEDVGDEREQQIAGVLDVFEVLPLRVVEGRIEEQVGHAHHGVDGIADFVTHVGQKIFLRIPGTLGLVPGGFERFLQGLLFGEVVVDTDRARHVTLQIVKGRAADEHPFAAVVLKAQLHLVHPRLAPAAVVVFAVHALGVRFGQKHIIGFTPDELIGRVAHHFAEARVGLDDHPFRIDLHETQLHVFDDAPVLLLALLDGGLHFGQAPVFLDTLGDVAGESGPFGLPVGQKLQTGILPEPDLTTVFGDDRKLGIRDRFAGL